MNAYWWRVKKTRSEKILLGICYVLMFASLFVFKGGIITRDAAMDWLMFTCSGIAFISAHAFYREEGKGAARIYMVLGLVALVVIVVDML